MSNEIHHKENDNHGMFFIKKDKGIASELTYILKENGVMVINHTETKVKFGGQGMASQLVKRAVEYARDKELKVDPLCPFAEVKFDENESYEDVRV